MNGLSGRECRRKGILTVLRKLFKLMLFAVVFSAPFLFVAILLLNHIAETQQIAPGNPIVEENLKPGTTDWQSDALRAAIERSRQAEENEDHDPKSYADGGSNAEASLWGGMRTIQGYAGLTSINHGDSIKFYVSTTRPSYQIDIYRIGWYGGAGARLIMTVTGLTGHNYPAPAPDSTTGMVEANWPAAYTLQTTTGWVTGFYQVKLTADDGSVGYLIFIVRDDSSTADILYQVGLTTYQAYNNWGGKSLYDHNSTTPRASKVSFDRPYEDAQGSGYLYDGDYNFVRWLERNGYNVTYATNLDTETNPVLMTNHTIFLSSTHDEYWSWNMRDHLKTWRDQGKHLAFFDANDVYWQIRFEPSSGGVPNRVEVCYKDATTDPMANRSTPWLTTVLWRDPPVNMPENALLGVMYGYTFDYYTNYDWTVQNASNWIYEGTGVQNGDTIPKVIGHEYDRVYDNGLTPPGLITLSNSYIPATGEYQNASIYTAPSGALVFDAATNRWSWLLDDSGYESTPVDPRIVRMTQNILNRMISTIPGGVTATPPPTVVPSATNTATSLPTVTATASATRTPTMTPMAGPSNTPSTTPANNGKLELQYRAGNTLSPNDNIEAGFNVVNHTALSVPLSQLKIRYYFTRDTGASLVFACEYADIGCSGKVTGTFTQLSTPVTGADYYLEVGFTSTAGSLAPGGQLGDTLVRINKSDWSAFTQTNDYSYDPGKTAYADWTQVTLYQNGTLIWGTPPSGSSATPTSAPTFVPPTNTPGATTPTSTPTSISFKIQYQAGATQLSNDQLQPNLQIVNLTGSGVSLSQFKIRYYFTRDTSASYVFSCYYAAVGCANVTGRFVTLTTSRPGADTYLEIGFLSGTLVANGSSGEIQVSGHTSTWATINQGNDYSFNAVQTSYADWTRITLYRNGVLVWGTEP